MGDFDTNRMPGDTAPQDSLSKLLAAREASGQAMIQPGGYDPKSTAPDPLSRLLDFRQATSQPMIQPDPQQAMTPEQIQAILSMLLAPGAV